MPHLFIEGTPATAGDLANQALVNYGALTSFRVELGGVRGLDLHLARLHEAAVELFGEPVGDARLRDLMRHAAGGRADCWLRVSLFSPEITVRDPSWRGAPRVMIAVSDPPAPLAGPLRLQLQTYSRDAPHLKHVAAMGLLTARRQAMAVGFDDALFLDANGRISEGSLWNIGFLEGDTIVWPEAPMLEGVAQALLMQGLAAESAFQTTRPVTRDDLADFDAAFICNSATPACAVTVIDNHAFADRLDLIDRLRAVWDAAPLQPI